jgi:multiple sugar transport system permease protein
MGWSLLTPSLVVLGIFGLLPFFYVIYVSFFNYNVFSAERGMKWAGADNFRKLVFDPEFLTSVGKTLTFAATVVTIELVLGFLLANTLLKDFRGKTIFRTIHALPLMVAPIAVGAVWRLLTIPDVGLLPYYLDRWFDYQYQIGRYASQAYWTTVFMDVWHWTPFVTLTMLAGLTALPKEPMEQALVDGANRFQVLRFLTIPLMMPIIITTVFIRLMDALRIVEEVYMVTGGGPANATRYLGILIWRVVFPQTNYGYGSAMSLVVLYMTIVLSWILFLVMSRIGRQPGQAR